MIPKPTTPAEVMEQKAKVCATIAEDKTQEALTGESHEKELNEAEAKVWKQKSELWLQAAAIVQEGSAAADQISLPPELQKYETSATFKDGLEIHFRPIQPQDEARLKELFYSHSEETIRQRYLAQIRDLTPEQLRKFVTLDYRRDFALVGLVLQAGRERMICVGRYFRNPSGSDAEIAITVHDDFQQHEIGTFLVRTLVTVAREHGITAFTATVLADNQAMLHVFRKVAGDIETKLESGVSEIRFELDGSARTNDLSVA